MKKLLSPLLFLFISALSISQTNTNSVYSISLNDIDGNPINLSSFQGKKILFCAIPFNSSSSDINGIDSLIKKNSSKLKVIGIPVREFGYVDSLKQDVKNIFLNRNIDLLITEPMSIQANSNSSISNLIDWLTQKSLNTRFDLKLQGIGQKFICDKSGKILMALQPNIPYDASIINTYININL